MICILKNKINEIMGLRITVTKLDRTLSILDSSKHRYLDCSHYDKCLNKAIRKNWESFSCINCARFIAFLEEEKAKAKKKRGRKKKNPIKDILKKCPGRLIYEKHLV